MKTFRTMRERGEAPALDFGRAVSDSDARKLAAEIRSKKPELDLHGFQPEQAADKIDVFLNDHYEGSDSVDIIYGIGTGKMRRTALQFLNEHPLVEDVIVHAGHCTVVFNKTEVN